jgi:hypothetical protein
MDKWISVKEKLPTDMKPVLTYYGFLDENGELYSGRYMGVMPYFAYDDDPHWQHEGSYGLTVTHWMPLPEPPKEMNNDG